MTWPLPAPSQRRPYPPAARPAPPPAPAPAPQPPPVRFVTVAEVAAQLRVSKMTVYRLVHGGEITAVRIGRSFRIPEQAVTDYLQRPDDEP